MQTRTYQLYATASQANAANATIVARGRITGVKWASVIDSTADNSAMAAELSFSSTSQISTNGAQGVIDAISEFQNIGAAGVGVSNGTSFTGGLLVPVQPGNVLYLNTSLTAGSCKCIVHVLED